MESKGIAHDELSIIEVYRCKICGLMVKGDWATCEKSDECIRDMCTSAKNVDR